MKQDLVYAKVGWLQEGTADANTLIGDDGDNLFQAGAGNDTMSGRGGYDVMLGGAGVDSALYAQPRAN